MEYALHCCGAAKRRDHGSVSSSGVGVWHRAAKRGPTRWRCCRGPLHRRGYLSRSYPTTMWQCRRLTHARVETVRSPVGTALNPPNSCPCPSLKRVGARIFHFLELFIPRDLSHHNIKWQTFTNAYAVLSCVVRPCFSYGAGSAYRVQPHLRSDARAVDRSLALKIRYSDSDGSRSHCTRLSVARVGRISRQFHRTSSRSPKPATDSRSP